MSRVFTDFPISEISQNHLFYMDSNDFVQRCETSFTLDEFEVVQIKECELKKLIQDQKYELCPKCVRYKKGI